MKLYSLIITRNILKSSKNSKALLYIILCAVYNTLYHKYPPSQTVESRVHQKAPTLFGVWEYGILLQHRLSAQRWADGITMWPNAVLTFNNHLGVHIVCLGYLWILRNVDKNVFFNLKILEKNLNHDLRDTLLHTIDTKCQSWCHPTEPL